MFKSSLFSLSTAAIFNITYALAAYGPLNFKAEFGSRPAPFKIDVDPQFIASTKLKASLTRAPIDIAVPEFTEGVPAHNITSIRDYWAHNYDWFAVQRDLNNKLHQFTTTIPSLQNSTSKDAIPLHFLHHKSRHANAIPLLFIHGWPGSFLEVERILPLLLNPASPSDPAFHVVAPSLPGFGFSPAPKKPGLGLIEAGAAFHELMQQLGYQRYVVQGGDFGSHTARYMGANFPGSVVSILSNLYSVSPNATDIQRRAANQTTEEENAFLAFLDASQPFTNTFWNVHSAIPEQLGILLGDSPVGNIAWPYLGMRNLAPGYFWTIEELITWGMMLYIQGPYGSVRSYKELSREGTLKNDFPYIQVPVGVLEYNGDAGYGVPREWCERSGNITYFVKKDPNVLGGHFPAHINPNDLVKEIRIFWGSKAGGWKI